MGKRYIDPEAFFKVINALPYKDDDTISRQAAIEAITDERIATNMDSVYDSELHRCKRATHRILASLPSVERHGRWNELPYSYECSVCGIIRPKEMTGKWHYCPNCGSRMDLEGEEE